MSLPPLLPRAEIHRRLQSIFPEGTPERGKCVRDAAAATVFAMLYVGAVEGTDRWLNPVHVVRMSDERAAKDDAAARAGYGRRAEAIGRRWYADNSREQIRDEVIRQGFVPNNAVAERRDVPTTSSLPRYALKAAFAALFDPALEGDAFDAATEQWRRDHLSAAALARISLVRRGAVSSAEGVLVRFPSGETRRMAAGPSSEIARSVIEDFAPRFLVRPAVLWLSESGAKIVARDDRLAADLRLQIDAARNLPDIILVDLGDTAAEFLLVFVEVVATDGPMTPQRVDALMRIAETAGYAPHDVAFVTAYLDRDHAAFKKTGASLAWRSFAWFASEPEHILALHDGSAAPMKLRRLVHRV